MLLKKLQWIKKGAVRIRDKGERSGRRRNVGVVTRMVRSGKMDGVAKRGIGKRCNRKWRIAQL